MMMVVIIGMNGGIADLLPWAINGVGKTGPINGSLIGRAVL